MNKIKLLRLLLIFSGFFACSRSYAQVGLNSNFDAIKYFTPPTPEMSGFQKYGDLPVNYNTGVPDIKVPLGQINLRDFSWPIFLSYHASGNKVEEFASSVGLGWVLQAGGFISQKGFSSSGNMIQHYLNLTTFGDKEINKNCNSALYVNENDVYTATIAAQEGVYNPDLYYLSSALINTRFMGNTTIPVSDIKISGTTVTDQKGNVYTFGIGQTSTTGGPCNTQNSSGGATYALTKIKTYKGDSLLFNYNTISYSYTGRPIETIQYSIAGQCGRCEATAPTPYRSCASLHTINEFVLTSIVASNGQKVVFDYGSRTDNTALKALTFVSFYETVNGVYQLVYNHQLQQGYTTNPNDGAKRLMLQSVQKQVSGQSFETYSFAYEPTALPAINSAAIDVAGYYNGQITNANALPSGGGRTPDFAYAKASILTGITYPAGGHTQFTYELNPGIWSGLRIHKIVDQDANNTTTKQRTYAYVGGDPTINIAALFQRTDYQYFFGSGTNGYSNADNPDGDTLIPCGFTTEQSVPIINTAIDWFSNIFTVNYAQVTEFTDDYTQPGTQGIFGKTDYIYNTHVNDNGRANLLPDPPLLTEKNTYKKDGAGFTLVKAEEYDYEVAADPTGSTTNPTSTAFWLQPSSPREYRDWAISVQMDHDCMLQQGNAGGYAWPKAFTALYFYIDVVPYYMTKSIIKDYPQNYPSSGNPVITESDYTYDHNNAHTPGALGAIQVDATGSNGKNYKNETRYTTSSDLSTVGYSGNMTAINKAAADNVVNPVWKRNSVNTTTVYKDQVYLNVVNNRALTAAEVTNPTGATSSKRLDVTYDIQNNPKQITTNSLSTTAYRYDHNNELTASCTACNYGDFAFSSFNDQNGSGFTYAAGGVTTSGPHASGAAYSFAAGGAISFSGFTVSGNYIIAGFTTGSAALTVTGASTVSYTQATTGYNGWYYFEQKVAPTAGTVTINGSALVDELRFYPAGKAVKTFAYGNFFNMMTAATDEKGITSFYEYDSQYRLINVRDQQGYILKNYCYNIAGQSVGCNVPTGPVFIYARVEITNQVTTTTDPATGSTATTGDVYIRLYSDAACTHLYAPPSATSVIIAESTGVSYGLGGSSFSSTNVTFSVTAGTSELYIGNETLYTSNSYYVDPYGLVTDYYNYGFDAAANGTIYTPETTFYY
jgi:hypothetical protein